MHRALNIKHRIVRRVNVNRAPLATFDSIDLGDGDGFITFDKPSDHSVLSNKNSPSNFISSNIFYQQYPKAEIIGGNNSKKSLSQAGGGKDEKKDAEAPDLAKNNQDQPAETGATSTASKGSQAPSSLSVVKDDVEERDKLDVSGGNESSEIVITSKKEEETCKKSPSNDSTVYSAAGLSRQGTLGRVSIPIRKQDSISSSSSSEACNDAHFTFTATRPSIAHLDSADAGPQSPNCVTDKDTVSSLIPEKIDPSQILSPSKRKAYEKRIERLRVTTSPIARPRSTAPINVVTLDEYANLSSPEASPASPSVLQDKLKITLPSDEFSSKSRTPKQFSAKRYDSEETCFEFTEEILFRCTKSALVVEEDGHLPTSPRRVLIPPTITPATSPKLSSSPRFGKEEGTEDSSTSAAPKLIFFKDNVSAQTFFGKTVDHTENEDWADFPDSQTNFNEPRENLAGDDITVEGLALPSVSEETLTKENKDLGEVPVDSAFNTIKQSDAHAPNCDINSGILTFDNSTDASSTQGNLTTNTTETSYSVKESSEDVLVLEIIHHESADKTNVELSACECDQDLKLNIPTELQTAEQNKESNLAFDVYDKNLPQDFNLKLSVIEKEIEEDSTAELSAGVQDSKDYECEHSVSEPTLKQYPKLDEQGLIGGFEVGLKDYDLKQEPKDEFSVIKQEWKDDFNILFDVSEQDGTQGSSHKEKEVSFSAPSSSQKSDSESLWTLQEQLFSPDEQVRETFDSFPASGIEGSSTQSSIPLFDLTETTADNQLVPDAKDLDLESSAASVDSTKFSFWCPPHADASSSTNQGTPFTATTATTTTASTNTITPEQGLLEPLESISAVQEHSTSLSPFDQQSDTSDSGHVSLTPFSDLHASFPTDLINFSSLQDVDDTMKEKL